jgi:rubrerythrin
LCTGYRKKRKAGIEGLRLEQFNRLLYNDGGCHNAMNAQELISGCIEIEQAAAHIYSSFMQLFPEERGFWEGLVNDELSHTSFLLEANRVGMFDGVPSEEMLLSGRIIFDTVVFTRNVKNNILYGPVSLEDALKIALKLEETMVEIFTNQLIAKLSNYQSQSALDEMLAAERYHLDKIRNRMIEAGFLKLS